MDSTKRQLLKLIGLSAIFSNNIDFLSAQTNPSQNTPFNKPQKLPPIPKIGIIAPATHVSDPLDLDFAKDFLSSIGFQFIFGKSFSDMNGYKTKSRSIRLDDIHTFYDDNSVDAIFCIRGGYGSAALLPDLDYALISKKPKIILGYSDITALLIAINQLANQITFHGPVLLSRFTQFTLDSFRRTFLEHQFPLKIENPIDNSIRSNFRLNVIRPGIAEGILTGGNLSIITSLLGTKFQINTFNKILFIEDVGEEPYRIHRMLIQLKLSGLLDQAKGIIIGKCNDCIQKSAAQVLDYTLHEVYNDIFKDYSIPVIEGYTIGHTHDQITLPLGISATINTNLKTFQLNESPFN